jgi:hypothetical protein
MSFEVTESVTVLKSLRVSSSSITLAMSLRALGNGLRGERTKDLLCGELT